MSCQIPLATPQQCLLKHLKRRTQTRNRSFNTHSPISQSLASFHLRASNHPSLHLLHTASMCRLFSKQVHNDPKRCRRTWKTPPGRLQRVWHRQRNTLLQLPTNQRLHRQCKCNQDLHLRGCQLCSRSSPASQCKLCMPFTTTDLRHRGSHLWVSSRWHILPVPKSKDRFQGPRRCSTRNTPASMYQLCRLVPALLSAYRPRHTIHKRTASRRHRCFNPLQAHRPTQGTISTSLAG